MNVNQIASSSQPYPPPAATGILPVLGWGAAVGVLLIGLSGMLLGKVGIEKMLTTLMFPTQASWLLLSGWLLHSIYSSIRSNYARRRWLAPLGIWCLFTLGGTPWLGNQCYRYLETRETLFKPDQDPPLDWLVVLGGATHQGPTRAEAGESGDRVVYAAQLFITGRARRLITTGSVIHEKFGSQNSPAVQTLEIWQGLGISAESIDTLPGINTSAELQALAQKIRDSEQAQPLHQPGPLRVGLLTSAWHLPRAMRLARAAGLPELIPVAADHKMRHQPQALWEYVPSADNFLRLERCQKEFMARLVSR
jgi:uncharacterized SAM-binding protein YcdF (DUF218 family)